MKLQAKVSREGILTAKMPKSLKGKSVIISIEEKKQKQSELQNLFDIFKEADKLKIPKRTHKDILKSLRIFKETL